MGQATSVYNPDGSYRIYHYPYSWKHRLTQFPSKFYLKYGKLPRHLVYGWVTMLPIFLLLNYKDRTAENKKMWKEKREHYADTWFDPIKAPPMPKIDEV